MLQNNCSEVVEQDLTDAEVVTEFVSPVHTCWSGHHVAPTMENFDDNWVGLLNGQDFHHWLAPSVLFVLHAPMAIVFVTRFEPKEPFHN
mmetsp:Transcript_55125/g.165139  ORF Transcript_55125/g.165139 Transcript_55125/m.165139 type:complete len:89 (-) Transcript_55125:1735-2001(-)